MRTPQILILSDASEVIKAINGKEELTINFVPLDISKISNGVDRIDFCHIPRNLN